MDTINLCGNIAEELKNKYGRSIFRVVYPTRGESWPAETACSP